MKKGLRTARKQNDISLNIFRSGTGPSFKNPLHQKLFKIAEATMGTLCFPLILHGHFHNHIVPSLFFCKLETRDHRLILASSCGRTVNANVWHGVGSGLYRVLEVYWHITPTKSIKLASIDWFHYIGRLYVKAASQTSLRKMAVEDFPQSRVLK